MNRVAVSAVVVPIAFMAILLWTRHPADTPSTPAKTTTMAAPVTATPSPSVASVGAIEGIARVIDGDTIEVSGTRIRLEGIDAPEGAQTCRRESAPYPCGLEAARALVNYADGKPVRCLPAGRDQYRRVLATCSMVSSGVDIGGWMVSQGYAFAFVRYSRRYVTEQAAAADAKRGFWVGSFDYPWDYRARLRSGASTE